MKLKFSKKGENNMEKNKKILIIFIVIIVCIAIAFGIHRFISTTVFNADFSIPNGKAELIEALKSINNVEERKERIDFFVQYNAITQEEANQLY